MPTHHHLLPAASWIRPRPARPDRVDRIAAIEGQLKLHTWMLSIIVGGIIILVLRSFT